MKLSGTAKVILAICGILCFLAVVFVAGLALLGYGVIYWWESIAVDEPITEDEYAAAQAWHDDIATVVGPNAEVKHSVTKKKHGKPSVRADVTVNREVSAQEIVQLTKDLRSTAKTSLPKDWDDDSYLLEFSNIDGKKLHIYDQEVSNLDQQVALAVAAPAGTDRLSIKTDKDIVKWRFPDNNAGRLDEAAAALELLHLPETSTRLAVELNQVQAPDYSVVTSIPEAATNLSNMKALILATQNIPAIGYTSCPDRSLGVDAEPNTPTDLTHLWPHGPVNMKQGQEIWCE